MCIAGPRDSFTGRFLPCRPTDDYEDGLAGETATSRFLVAGSCRHFVPIDDVSDEMAGFEEDTAPSPEDILIGDADEDGYSEYLFDRIYLAMMRAPAPVKVMPAIAPASEVRVEEFDFVDSPTYTTGAEIEEVVDREADACQIAETMAAYNRRGQNRKRNFRGVGREVYDYEIGTGKLVRRIKPPRPGRRYENAQRIALRTAIRHARHNKLVWLSKPDWPEEPDESELAEMVA